MSPFRTGDAYVMRLDMKAKSIGIGTTTETKQIGEGEEMIVELTPRTFFFASACTTVPQIFPVKTSYNKDE